tara:strand:- start:34 stop:249 length:216 start_codon:yes stop_codon:yes gene_type:complete
LGGYYINDIFRTDFELNYTNFKFKKARLNVINREDDIEVFVNNKLKRDSTALSLIANIYADLFISNNTIMD